MSQPCVRGSAVSQSVWWGFAICLCGLTLIQPLESSAEFYVAGQLGPQLSNNFGNVGATGGPAGVSFSDVDLNNSLALGAKAGYFFPQVPNLGLEVSASHAKPNLNAQPSVVTGPVPGIFAFDRTSFRVVTVALNVIARAQIKGFEPYAGVGMGLFFARLKDAAGATSSDNGVPGFNALAGYRSFLTDDRRLALVVEYNYQRARLNFSNVFDPSVGLGTGLRGDYEAHTMMVGLSYHFN